MTTEQNQQKIHEYIASHSGSRFGAPIFESEGAARDGSYVLKAYGRGFMVGYIGKHKSHGHREQVARICKCIASELMYWRAQNDKRTKTTKNP
jgi:hypothetical protein